MRGDLSCGSVPWIEMNDGNRIPQIGFGLSVPRGKAAATVLSGLEAGYRLIDTAAQYRTEIGLGEALLRSGVNREDVFITTKLSNHGHAVARRSFERSLKHLGTDYVDLYLIHYPFPAQGRYVETWAALNELKAAGRARSIGVSNFRIDHLARIIEATGVVPAINQIEVHPRFQQQQLRRFHAQSGIVTEAYSPLEGGRAIREPAVQAIAARHRRTPAQIVLRWHIQQGNVVIPRSVTRARLVDNLRIFDFELGVDDMRRLADLDSAHRSSPDPASFLGPSGVYRVISEFAESHPAVDPMVRKARKCLTAFSGFVQRGRLSR
jgi:2,5-diketo-D-gluconate reductase A